MYTLSVYSKWEEVIETHGNGVLDRIKWFLLKKVKKYAREKYMNKIKNGIRISWT